MFTTDNKNMYMETPVIQLLPFQSTPSNPYLGETMPEELLFTEIYEAVGKATVKASLLRENGYKIHENIKDDQSLELQTYIDKNGNLKVDVTIPQHAFNLVNVEFLSKKN